LDDDDNDGCFLDTWQEPVYILMPAPDDFCSMMEVRDALDRLDLKIQIQRQERKCPDLDGAVNVHQVVNRHS